MKRITRGVSFSIALLLSLNMTACAADPSVAETTSQPLALSAAPGLTAPTVSFTDVPDDAWYAQAVSDLLEKGMMNGVGDNRFGPEETFTRASLVTVLYRMAEEPAVTGEDSFTDTLSGQWYSNAVTWAEQTGVVQGYGNGLFGTEDPVTGEQLALMLWRQAGEPATETGETYGAHDYAQAAVRWADQRGLVSGGPAFAAADPAPRSRVADMVYHYLLWKESADMKGFDFSRLTNVELIHADLTGMTGEELAVLYQQARYCQAMTEADVDTMRELVSEDMTFTHMSGRTQTREEYFANVASGALRYFTIGIDSPVVEVNGNVASVTYTSVLNANAYGAWGTYRMGGHPLVREAERRLDRREQAQRNRPGHRDRGGGV